jgi:hypothetical protein
MFSPPELPDLNQKQYNFLTGRLLPLADYITAEVRANTNVLKPLVEHGIVADGNLNEYAAAFCALSERAKTLAGTNPSNCRYKINDNLNPSFAANAKTDDTKDPPTVIVQLRSEFLDPEHEQVLVLRVRTLLHEVGHTVPRGETFPIKDYSYVGGWGTSDLGPLYLDNADTLAEAVAQVAQQPDKAFEAHGIDTGAWSYRILSTALAQQRALRDAGADVLRAALGWADYRINRAWLSADEYRVYASDIAFLNSKQWLSDFEAYLRDKWDFIGPRKDYRLSAVDQERVATLYTAVLKVKRRLDSALIRVTNGGKLIFKPEEQCCLYIPVEMLSKPVSAGAQGAAGTSNLDTAYITRLGENILDSIFSSLDTDVIDPTASQAQPNANQNSSVTSEGKAKLAEKRSPIQVAPQNILRKLLEYEEPLVKAALENRSVAFGRVENSKPIKGGDELRAWLCLAMLEHQAAELKRFAAKLALPAALAQFKSDPTVVRRLQQAPDAVSNLRTALTALVAASGNPAVPLLSAVAERVLNAQELLSNALSTFAETAAKEFADDADQSKQKQYLMIFNDFAVSALQVQDGRILLADAPARV